MPFWISGQGEVVYRDDAEGGNAASRASEPGERESTSPGAEEAERSDHAVEAEQAEPNAYSEDEALPGSAV